MRKSIRLGIIMICTAMALAEPVRAQTDGLQYKAALTRIFLWNYYAFPLFRQNPVFPGEVIRIDNEKMVLDHHAGCYSGLLNGNYVATKPYTGGMEVALSGQLRGKATLLDDMIAKVEAGVSGRFGKTASLRISPLSIDDAEGGSQVLKNWDRNKSNCSLIGETLSGKPTGHFLVAEVLHGQVRHELTISFDADLSAKAQSDVGARIAGAFSVKQVDVAVSARRASFEIVETPGAMSLAIVPDVFNADELRRITYFLRGERGANLEIAVQEAARAEELSEFRSAVIRVRELMGDEIGNRERWAQRFTSGDRTMTVAEFREKGRDGVDMRRVGNYAAAMVLISRQ